MPPFLRLIAFVDWNSQIYAFGDKSLNPKDLNARVLKRVARNIVKALTEKVPDSRFLVDLRVYHGWHKGFEPTPNRKALEQVFAETDFSALSTRPGVVFSGEFAYGDRLLLAKQERLHARPVIHLANTLRSQDANGALEEKMVDTALASDLVSHAATEPGTWLMAVGEDDDLVPPILNAEALLIGGARVLLLRKRLAGPFLKLDDIFCGVS